MGAYQRIHRDRLRDDRTRRSDAPSGQTSAEIAVRSIDFALQIWDADPARAKSQVSLAAAMLHGDLDDQPAPDALPAPAGQGLLPWQVRRLHEFIDASLDTKIRVEDCARRTRLSTSHFSRAFKATFGMTMLAYIHRRRVARAQQLMLASGQSLSGIAFSCGFSDQAHYCRVFRAVAGVSPSRWRRQMMLTPPADQAPTGPAPGAAPGGAAGDPEPPDGPAEATPREAVAVGGGPDARRRRAAGGQNPRGMNPGG